MSSIEYERVNWENGRTPLGANNLNKGDKAIADLVDYVNKSNIFTLQSSAWHATGNAQYPWSMTISSDQYNSSDIPICQVWGTNEIETDIEVTNITYIKKVIVDSSGITVYASSKPTIDLKLVLKV